MIFLRIILVGLTRRADKVMLEALTRNLLDLGTGLKHR